MNHESDRDVVTVILSKRARDVCCHTSYRGIPRCVIGSSAGMRSIAVRVYGRCCDREFRTVRLSRTSSSDSCKNRAHLERQGAGMAIARSNAQEHGLRRHLPRRDAHHSRRLAHYSHSRTRLVTAAAFPHGIARAAASATRAGKRRWRAGRHGRARLHRHRHNWIVWRDPKLAAPPFPPRV